MALQQRTAIARRAAFSGRVAPCRPAAASRRGPVKVQALLREWSPTNKEFIDLVLSEFPDKGVATVEEARVSKSNWRSGSANGPGQWCAVTMDLSTTVGQDSCYQLLVAIAVFGVQ
jgi:hypothetical protein